MKDSLWLDQLIPLVQFLFVMNPNFPLSLLQHLGHYHYDFVWIVLF